MTRWKRKKKTEMSDIYGRHRKDARQAEKRAFSSSKKKLKSFHQWEVSDLRRAGLNPILSAGGPTPGLAGAVAMPQGGDIFGGAATSARDIVETAQKAATAKSAVITAREAARGAGFAANVKENEEVITAHGRDAAFHNANRAMADSQTATYNTTSARNQATLSGFEIPGARSASQFQATRAGKYTKQFGQAVENILGPVKPYIGFGVNTGRAVRRERSQQNRIRDRR